MKKKDLTRETYLELIGVLSEIAAVAPALIKNFEGGLPTRRMLKTLRTGVLDFVSLCDERMDL